MKDYPQEFNPLYSKKTTKSEPIEKNMFFQYTKKKNWRGFAFKNQTLTRHHKKPEFLWNFSFYKDFGDALKR